jgi:elongation factor P
MNATQLRKGMVIKHDDDLFSVFSMEHITPGKGRAFVQTKLRNLRTGRMVDQRFRSNDAIEQASLTTAEMEYLYDSGDDYHFMNQETYEQITLPREILGKAVDYLVPNVVARVQVHGGRPVGIELPGSVVLEVVDTEPGIKGASAQAQSKPATLETGLVVQVPYFVETGEKIRVDTFEGKYMERVK